MLKINNNFKRTERIASIPIFENRLPHPPKFTIGICTYNRPILLAEALESAINQDTDIPFEIIVCDNSPERDDQTEHLMNKYRHVRNLSYYKHSENILVAGNWNRLVTLARSEYFVMLHDDDCIAPFYIRLINELWSFLPKDVALLQTSKKTHNEFAESDIKKSLRRIYFSDNLHIYAIGCPSGACYKRDAILNLGGWNNDFNPNLDYCFDVLLCLHYKAYVTSTQATFYRWGDNDTLKLNTRIELVKKDSRLHDAMLRKLLVPAWFRRRWLEEHLPQQLEQYELEIDDVAPMRLNKYNPTIRHSVFAIVNRYIGLMKKMKLCR